MSIRGRIFFIVMSCLSLGLIFAFIVAERDLGASLQDQIQIELQKQGQIIKSSLGPLSQYNDLNSLKDETDALAQASQSRIQDADFAAETSKLTKSQILSQAATSMLAQANASKQNLLALLQG